MNISEGLKVICNEVGVSGYEDKVSQIVLNLFKETCDEVGIDAFGSIIAFKKGTNSNSKKIILMAHIDEIGFMVKNIDKDGFVSFTNIGGIDPKILLAQEVIIQGREDIYGIIGAKPPHLLKYEEVNKAPKLDELFIDIGMNRKAAQEVVKIGDIITIKNDFKKLKSHFSSKALDNRAGVWSLYEASKIIKSIVHENDIYYVTSVQEEVGLRGAYITSYNIDADVSIVVDVCFGEFPEGSKDENFPLGKGPVIAKGPILNPKVTKLLIDVAKENNIPYKIDVEPSSTGTEAWATQVSRGGIPTALISIPIRYMHTPIEQICGSDIRNTAKLLSYMALISTTELEEILCY